ncbi:MAG: geranylgeranyl reductase family protein [Anaerolineae bacterium]|nr:geranylgeranyl reductase family protein [Anaerolineae bacterium]
MEREVVVVGAGPGGATAAMALAQQGHDVLLIDKDQFPRDKTCGDAIPAGAIDILSTLGLKEKIAQAGFYPARQMMMVSPHGYQFVAPFPPSEGGSESYIVPRLKFDHLLYQHALESGAEFCQAQVIAPLLERGRVIGVRLRENGAVREIHSRLLIAADGSTSVIARALRPDKQQEMHRAVAIRAYLDNFTEYAHEIEFYLYKGILPGYAWIFPTAEGQANVGLGIRLDYFRQMKGNLEKMLDRFLNMPAIKQRFKHTTQIHSLSTWQLNFGSQPVQKVYEGALLVGDAAAQINPLTGGGIYNAVAAAQFAAATAHEALLANDLSRQRLYPYQTLCDEQLGPSMHRSFLMQKWLFRFPLLVEGLIRTLGANSSFAQTFLNKL